MTRHLPDFLARSCRSATLIATYTDIKFFL